MICTTHRKRLLVETLDVLMRVHLTGPSEDVFEEAGLPAVLAKFLAAKHRVPSRSCHAPQAAHGEEVKDGWEEAGVGKAQRHVISQEFPIDPVSPMKVYW